MVELVEAINIVCIGYDDMAVEMWVVLGVWKKVWVIGKLFAI